MQKEIFKDILGYEGLYQVSNMGNVKSVGYGKEKILNLNKEGTGYYVVNLSKDGKQKTNKVHQLVAIAFLRHKKNGYKLVVDHKDNNRLNNRLENLQLISHRENVSKDWKGNTSKYTGVSWNKRLNKWVAQIVIEGKQKHLGYFKDEYEAHLSYQKALKNIIKSN